MNERTDALQWPALPGPWHRITRPFRLAFLTACLVGAITHLYLFTNLLLNHDSATQLYTNNDVLSSGRTFSSRVRSSTVFLVSSMTA